MTSGFLIWSGERTLGGEDGSKRLAQSAIVALIVALSHVSSTVAAPVKSLEARESEPGNGSVIALRFTNTLEPDFVDVETARIRSDAAKAQSVTMIAPYEDYGLCDSPSMGQFKLLKNSKPNLECRLGRHGSLAHKSLTKNDLSGRVVPGAYDADGMQEGIIVAARADDAASAAAASRDQSNGRVRPVAESPDRSNSGTVSGGKPKIVFMFLVSLALMGLIAHRQQMRVDDS